MTGGDHLGPALREVSLEDPEALAALFAEQRARLATVRDEGIWHWFGGVPVGFGSPRVVLHALWLQFACVGLLAAALVAAGLTHGPVLWSLLALAGACLLLRWLLLAPPTRATLRFFRRAVLLPGYVVAHDPRAEDPADEEGRAAAVLVALDGAEPARLRELLATGARLQRLVAGAEPASGELADFVAAIRDGVGKAVDDGSRLPVPAALGGGACELARVAMAAFHLPGERFTSRLVFVLADPAMRAPGHTRLVQSSLWGAGVQGLCAAAPREVPA